MKEFYVMNLSTTIVIFIATLIFAWVCFKRKSLFSWLSAYISATLSEVFRLFSQEQYDTTETISISFSALTVLLFVIAVSHEYYRTFSKTSKKVLIPSIFFLFQQHFTSMVLQIIIAFLLVIAMFLIIRIYLRKKTPTHAFMCFILSTGLFQLLTSILRDQGYAFGDELLEFSRVVMVTVMLITGVVAIIEERIVRSENKYRLAYNRAEFYKDLFVHDINNILQNLEFSLEIIYQECVKHDIKEDIKDLLNLAKTQVNRGAELGINVRKLSDLELGKIKSRPIQVNEVLEKAIDYIIKRFPDSVINIVFDPKGEKYIVKASDILYDVFRIILNNAVRYNDNPEVQIIINFALEKIEGINYVRLDFMDNGPGMPDKMKQNIFYNVYEKPEGFKRIGLGLLLVREVIQSFNGKIWAEDRVKGDYKKGTNIIMLIPEIY
ncbi:MAG: sensor histidine kinase [Candidatus Thorarchaeota archaeon]